MGSSKQEYWRGLPFPPWGDLPDPGVESASPALQADSLLSEPPGKPPASSNHPLNEAVILGLSLVCSKEIFWTLKFLPHENNPLRESWSFRDLFLKHFQLNNTRNSTEPLKWDTRNYCLNCHEAITANVYSMYVPSVTVFCVVCVCVCVCVLLEVGAACFPSFPEALVLWFRLEGSLCFLQPLETRTSPCCRGLQQDNLNLDKHVQSDFKNTYGEDHPSQVCLFMLSGEYRLLPSCLPAVTMLKQQPQRNCFSL